MILFGRVSHDDACHRRCGLYRQSYRVYALLERGDRVVVLDNLSTGVKAQVGQDAAFVLGDVADATLVKKTIADHQVDSVIHFAGSIVVPDSVADPALGYYENNVVKSRALIAACVEAGIKHFLFSSTATVYAEDARQPLAEGERKAPISPYARSKLMTEWMLEDVSRATPLRHIVLRYFNVAGADAQGRIPASSTPKSHTPDQARAARVGAGPGAAARYFRHRCSNLADGTGVRDYIHVTDLAEAHLLALDALKAGAASTVYNVGYGRGLSVREVIAGVEKVTGERLPARESPRRPGDPPTLISDPTRLKTELGWTPRHEDLDGIIRTAIAWERRINT